MLVSIIIGLFLFVTVNDAEEIVSDAPCPATWTFNEISKTCVKPYNGKKVWWKKARDICQCEGGDLVVIHNSQMNDFVQGILSLKRYWIGSRYNSTTKMMRYLDGEQMKPTFEAWAPRQPNNIRGNQECIEILGKRGGLWNDKPCKRRSHFLCEKQAFEKETKPKFHFCQGPCAQDWVYYPEGESCLLFDEKRKADWAFAAYDCKDVYNAELVRINDKRKDDFVRELVYFGRQIQRDFWVAAYRKVRNDGTTLWLGDYIDSVPMGDYQPWTDEDYHKAKEDHDCVKMDTDLERWTFDVCWKPLALVCERHL